MCIFGKKSRPSVAAPAPSLPEPATYTPPVAMQTQAAPTSASATPTSQMDEQKKTGRRSLIIPLISGGGSGLNVPG